MFRVDSCRLRQTSPTKLRVATSPCGPHCRDVAPARLGMPVRFGGAALSVRRLRRIVLLPEPTMDLGGSVLVGRDLA